MKHATHCWFTRVQYLVLTLFLSVGLSLIAGTVMAQEAKVTSLMDDVSIERTEGGTTVDLRRRLREGSWRKLGSPVSKAMPKKVGFSSRNKRPSMP